MRSMFLEFCLLLGLLIGGIGVSKAETIAATGPSFVRYVCGGTTYDTTPGSGDTTPNPVCTNQGLIRQSNEWQCRVAWYGASVCQIGTQIFSASCPTGQNWTQSGSNCTRPDCVAPQVRDPADGICKGPVCPTDEVGGWYSMPRGGDVTGTYCTSGCSYSLAGDLSAEIYDTATTTWRRLIRFGNGTACSGGSPVPNSSAVPPTAPDKPSPCAAGEGVIATSGGKVLCVPGATPGADVPKVSKETQVETKSDGSTITTTTTNTCTGAGACSTSTTITVGPAAGGGAGLAGTPGTSTGVKDSPPSETSEYCAKNPNQQICKGGMNEEATQKKVLTELERFNAPTASDDSALSAKGDFSGTKTEALQEQDDRLTQAATGVSIDGGITSSRTAWGSAMSEGWFTAVTLSGCQPIVSTFAGKTWTLDHCPTAEKISNLGAYAMWFMLVVGVFVMLTGGANRGA